MNHPSTDRTPMAVLPPTQRRPAKASARRPTAAVDCSRLLGRMRAEKLVPRYHERPHGALAVECEAEALVDPAKARPGSFAIEAQVPRATSCRVGYGPTKKGRRKGAARSGPPNGQAMQIERLARRGLGPEHGIGGREAHGADGSRTRPRKEVETRVNVGSDP